MSASAAIVLRLDAPFSAWRWLQAGVYRATFPVIPPSAAWGLVLNLAGIETRGSLAEVVTSIRPEAPALEIAVGVQRAGQRSVLYQQLHSYPVGNSGSELAAPRQSVRCWSAWWRSWRHGEPRRSSAELQKGWLGGCRCPAMGCHSRVTISFCTVPSTSLQ
jgi:CRISPR-associated Cas5-like protein